MPQKPSLIQELRYLLKDHRVIALSAANSIAVLILFCLFAVFFDGLARKRAYADVRERHERVDRKLREVPTSRGPDWAALPHEDSGVNGGASAGVPLRESPQRWAVPQPRNRRSPRSYPVEVRGRPTGRSASWEGAEPRPSYRPPALAPTPEPRPQAFDPESEAPPAPEPETDLIPDPTVR